MRTIFRFLTLVLIGTFLLLMHPRSSCAEVIVDQEQTAPWTLFWKIGNIYAEMAQIVTAGTHGIFYKVSLYVDNVSASGPVRVSIQTLIDGEPSGNDECW